MSVRFLPFRIRIFAQWSLLWTVCKSIEQEHIVQISSGIARDRVLYGKLYAQRLQKLIYLHLVTDCFM